MSKNKIHIKNTFGFVLKESKYQFRRRLFQQIFETRDIKLIKYLVRLAVVIQYFHLRCSPIMKTNYIMLPNGGNICTAKEQ